MLVKTVSNSLSQGEAFIQLTNGGFCIVDPCMLDMLSEMSWYGKPSAYRIYAVHRFKVNGKVKQISMHRLIANTPVDLLCHHNNHDSLDNRYKNLQNMLEYDHIKLHSWR